MLWPVYLFAWIAIAYRLPTLAVAVVGDLPSTLYLLFAILAVWVALRAWRLSRARRLRELVYEEADPTLATTMELSSVRV